MSDTAKKTVNEKELLSHFNTLTDGHNTLLDVLTSIGKSSLEDSKTAEKRIDILVSSICGGAIALIFQLVINESSNDINPNRINLVYSAGCFILCLLINLFYSHFNSKLCIHKYRSVTTSVANQKLLLIDGENLTNSRESYEKQIEDNNELIANYNRHIKKLERVTKYLKYYTLVLIPYGLAFLSVYIIKLLFL